MVFKIETVVFSQNRSFLVPDEQLLRLDNRQDSNLRPYWDRHNNNDERACLSAPFITSLVSQSRGLQCTKRRLCLNVQQLHYINCQFTNEHNNVIHLVYGSTQSNRFDRFQ